MDIIKQFNLPSYIKGKSFAEASKCIAKKFKDRTSPEDIATLNELQGRLRDAQEFVKAEKEKRSMPQQAAQTLTSGGSAGAPAPEPASTSYKKGGKMYYESGGLMNLLEKIDQISGGEGDMQSGMGKVAGTLGAATTLGNQAFGETGIDTSGASQAPQVASQGFSAASGAMAGATTGMQFGPMGAAIGGVVGGLSGLIGGGKRKKDAEEAAANYDMAQHYKATNQYSYGGKMKSKSYNTGGSTNPFNFMEDLVGQIDSARNMEMGDGNTDFMRDTKDLNRNISLANNLEKAGLSPLTTDNTVDTSGMNVKRNSDFTIPEKKIKFNPSELLRYTPAAMNAMQLSSQKPPESIGLDRIDRRYNEQRVDERGLQNTVQEAVNNNRNALLSSSGGSGSAARAALLASQLQGTKALSDAYQKATAENRQESRNAQQFNLGVDRMNLNQSNREKDLNLEQKAAYETNRSRLLAQIGQDLGGIGREELLKRFPELMGLSYNWRGKKNKMS